MKSLKDYSLNLSEEDYHNYPAWSYSIIAKYAKDGFSALTTLHDRTEPTDSMRFGSLFDSIVTKGRKTLDEYAVVDMSVPEAERKVLDVLASTCTCPFEEIPMNQITIATESTGYYPRWNPDTRYKHLVSYKDYYEVVRSGKKLVSKTDWDDAMTMFKAFRENEYLNSLFGTKNTKDVEFIYQSQYLVKWDIEGESVDIKIMPDLLVVDHKNKTIQPVDLKTSSVPAFSFWENFIKFRYDIQAELYSDVLREVISSQAVEYNDYTVLPFIFADISRSDKYPVSWDYDPSNGFSYTKGERTYQYKGWKELLSEILVYEANEAKVPKYIRTDGPNSIIDILSRNECR